MTQPDQPIDPGQKSSPESMAELDQSHAKTPEQPETQDAPASPDQSDRYINVTAATSRGYRPPGLPTSRKILIALMLPILTALVILLIYSQRRQTVVEYQTGLLNVGDRFVKLLSEGDIGTAYDMLLPDTQRRVAAEALENDYHEATSGLGDLQERGSYKWGPAPKGEAPTSYTARFIYKNGKMDVTLKFRDVRMGSEDAPLEHRISECTFKRIFD